MYEYKLLADYDKRKLTEYATLLMNGEGKACLDQMLDDGLTYDQIREFYDSVNFYPNSETVAYAYEKAKKA